MQDIHLCSTKASKAIRKLFKEKTDSVYVETLETTMEACDDNSSLDKVYFAHKDRINALPARYRDELLTKYAELQESFMK
jgi:hypothetical protein